MINLLVEVEHPMGKKENARRKIVEMAAVMGM